LEKKLQSQDQFKAEDLYDLATKVAKKDTKAKQKGKFFGHTATQSSDSF